MCSDLDSTDTNQCKYALKVADSSYNECIDIQCNEYENVWDNVDKIIQVFTFCRNTI